MEQKSKSEENSTEREIKGEWQAVRFSIHVLRSGERLGR